MVFSAEVDNPAFRGFLEFPKMKSSFFLSCAAAIVLSSACSSVFAQAGSDDCASPTPISGSGQYAFDLAAATTSNSGFMPNCIGGASFASNDVWWCWTATCTGMVTLSTCGLTNVDTVVAIYPTAIGCSCPGDLSPLCCNNNACNKQSEVSCEVVCGQRYLIQVGAIPGSILGIGQLSLQCVGSPCGPAEPFGCDCCGGRPPMVDSFPVPFAAGAVAAATNDNYDSGFPAVWLVEIGGQPSAPVGSNWATGRYSHPNWTMSNLGSVFGVTLDGTGNVFVGHSSVYGSATATDYLGAGGAGAIYRLDGTTGAVTTIINLPQQVDPSQPLTEQYPGLGQLSYDCGSRRLFASNFEDGRIYSIDPLDVSGFKVRSTFTHGGATTGALPNGSLADPTDPAGFEPLGTRIWAVKATGGRVFYSLWTEDQGRPSPQANEIWSVDVDALGNFIANSEQLECALPSSPGGNWSNPIADISFDDECCMLAAERSMQGDSRSNAHQSRAFRFCHNAAGSWDAPTIYGVGGYGSQSNATGGIGYQGGAANQVWNMSDAIIFPNPKVYGLYGQDPAGEVAANATWVDLDGVLSNTQKMELGSLDISCVLDACMEVVTNDIGCDPQADGTMEFDWTFTITNQSTEIANVLILPDTAFAPYQVLTLNPPLDPGSSATFTVHITGQQPLATFCFPLVLGSVQGNICCMMDVCLELPECECFEDNEIQVWTSGVGQFNVTFALTNLEAFAGEWVSIAVAPGVAATVSPSIINIPTTPYAGIVAVGPIQVTTALPPGSSVTLIIGLHSLTYHPCCFRELKFVLPAGAPVTVPGDLNEDGIIDAADLSILLSEWGNPKSVADIDGDGAVGATDLATLLSNWG
jgi:Dockerin type I domain